MENPQNDMNETLITLTSDIVAAHVSNNNVAVEDVPALITNVYGALVWPWPGRGRARSDARTRGFDPLFDQAGLHRLP